MIWLHEDGNEIAPGIIVLDNALSSFDCKSLLSAILQDDDWYSGTVADPNNDGDPMLSEARKVRVKELEVNFQTEPILYTVSRSIFHYGIEYSNMYKTNFNDMERITALHYTPGDYYKSHADAGPSLMNRSFSTVVYLNDVEEGGETYFNHFDVSVEPKEGRMVMFPSCFLYAHEARTPVDGDKFALATWFRVI